LRALAVFNVTNDASSHCLPVGLHLAKAWKTLDHGVAKTHVYNGTLYIMAAVLAFAWGLWKAAALV
jgi:hypothetical protein